VAFTSYSRGGPGVSLALTKDFRSFERLGVIMSPDDKDGALLPRKINGIWTLIHRPMTPLGAHIWLSSFRICAIGETTNSCWKPAAARAGTQTRSACRLPRSRHSGPGWWFITASFC